MTPHRWVKTGSMRHIDVCDRCGVLAFLERDGHYRTPDGKDLLVAMFGGRMSEDCDLELARSALEM